MELERQTLMGSTDKQYYSIIYHENLASENINFSEFHFMTYYNSISAYLNMANSIIIIDINVRVH